jgi:hypothetical protein
MLMYTLQVDLCTDADFAACEYLRAPVEVVAPLSAAGYRVMMMDEDCDVTACGSMCSMVTVI